MANKGANRKDPQSHQQSEYASTQHELLLPPLIIGFDETLHLTREASQIRQLEYVSKTHVEGATAPPTPIIVEQATVEELPLDESPSQNLQEVETHTTPREAVVKVEIFSGTDQDGSLSKYRMQWPRLSLNQILSKFMFVKNVGRLTHKGVYFTSIILISIALVGGISVVGLLQSSERVGTSGIIIQPPPPPPYSPPTPLPPEPTVEIDIFGDIGCTTAISEIVWGSVEAGSSTSETVYVKNSGDQSIILSLNTENWNPTGAFDYMDLLWDYDVSPLDSGAVVDVTLTLAVDSSITGIESFSFDIVIIGSAS